MCRIPRTCQPKRAVGGLEELDMGEELEQTNVQNPSHLSVRTTWRELEELDLGEELEQANVQNPAHLSIETSCRELEELDPGERVGAWRRVGAGECAGSLAPVSRNELSGRSGAHRESDQGKAETYLETYPRIRSSIYTNGLRPNPPPCLDSKGQI